jgi:4-alpha-glucanotransferase
MPVERSTIEELAHLYGVETSFVDTWRQRRTVSTEALFDTCRLLGANLEKTGDVSAAIRDRQHEISRQIVEPVYVVRENSPAAVTLRTAKAQHQVRFQWHLELEEGLTWEASGRIDELPLIREESLDGNVFFIRSLPLRETLPSGYHRLVIEMDGRSCESLIVVAPVEAYAFPSPSARRHWGVFVPLYSVYRRSSCLTGNYSDLSELMQWIAGCGGSFVATLPLLSTLWELTDDPSPYQPASRLFWNEFYLDLTQLPEYSRWLETQSFRSDETFETGLVNYSAEMNQKRRALQALSDSFFRHASSELDELNRRCECDPELKLFAQFRAVGERQRRPWTRWPERLQRGMISKSDYDESVYQYHLFTQWRVKQQLAAIKKKADERGLLWYLDYPLGVSDAGYDVWRHQDLFVREAAGGAPPDDFFTRGQNWGFPPMHPERLRRDGYAYFRQTLRAHLQHARVLRLDHIMGLYRFYWIPRGNRADDGAYVRYPIEEMFAILALESHRHGARLIGENLGTVPEEVNEALDRHNVDGMYVLQFAANADDPQSTIPPVPSNVAASLNTHDTPPFAAFWEGSDIDDRASLDLLKTEDARQEHARRQQLRQRVIEFLQRERLLETAEPTSGEVLSACLAFLARSEAEFVVVTLEDLWGERQPQNRPGTYGDMPNWRRRAAYSLEAFRELPAVRDVLRRVDRLRREAGN